MVVGIIATITLFGASALIEARERYILNSVVEETVSTIRDMQNRAISVAEGRSAWGFRFNQGSTAIEVFDIEEVQGTGGSIFRTNLRENETEILASGTQITQNPTGDNINIIFVAPFGTSYLASGGCQGQWRESLRPSLEIEPISPCQIHNEATFTISYQEKSAQITVNRRGDIEVRM